MTELKATVTVRAWGGRPIRIKTSIAGESVEQSHLINAGSEETIRLDPGITNLTLQVLAPVDPEFADGMQDANFDHAP